MNKKITETDLPELPEAEMETIQEDPPAPVLETPKPETLEPVWNEYQQEAASEFDEFFDDLPAESNVEIILYRVREDKRRGRSFLKRYWNRRPKEEEIGEEFGSGLFVLMGKHPVTGKLRSKQLDIDPYYDAIHQNFIARQAPEQTVSTQNPLEQLRIMADIFGKLNQGATKAPADPLNVMSGIMDIFTGGLKKMQGAVLDNAIQTVKSPPEESEKSEGVDSILKMIAGFGEKFLNSKGSESKLMEQMIKMNPQFQAAQQDRDLIVEIYDNCVADPKIGKETIDGIMGKLGIEVPVDGEEQPINQTVTQ
jgi:hypothetical protein